MELMRIAYVLLTLCSRPLPYGEAMEYAHLYHGAAKRWGLPVEVVLGVALYENRACDPNVVSKTNDVGLMQIHTRGGRQIEIYRRPSWNIERGCEKLWNKRRRTCWGKRNQRQCLAQWLQGYNPGSKGYGENVTGMVHWVAKKAQQFNGEIMDLTRWLRGD